MLRIGSNNVIWVQLNPCSDLSGKSLSMAKEQNFQIQKELALWCSQCLQRICGTKRVFLSSFYIPSSRSRNYEWLSSFCICPHYYRIRWRCIVQTWRGNSWVFHDTSVVESLRKKHKIKDPRSAPSKPPGNVKDNQSNAPAQNRLTGNKRIYPPSTPVRLEKNQAPRNDQRICLGSPLPSKIKATKCKLHPIWKRKIIQLLQCKTLMRK